MTVRWGIIGCGDVCEVKSGPAFGSVEGSELVAVMRRDAARAEDYARRHGVPRWYDDAAALIADPDVDAVYVATPPGSHCDYALRCARAGKPAYVEKPMARNAAECRRMVDAFREAGIPLFVAYYRRALPRFTKVRDLLDSGALGEITGVFCRYDRPPQDDLDPAALPWRLRAEESGGGLFFDLGSHALDLLDFLLGPLEDVSGAAFNRGSPYDVEDGVVMHFRAAGGSGVASWNFASSIEEDRVEIIGRKGRVTFAVFGDEPVRLQKDGAEETFEIPHPPHIQQPLIETVVGELQGRGRCPSTGESAARTARVMDAVVESYYGTRETGFWDRPERWPGRPRR